MKLKCRTGTSLVELLIVVVIASMVVMSMGIPYITGRSFFRKGMNQSTAQRDAHLTVKHIAQTAREASAYSVVAGTGSLRINFTTDCGVISFEGGPLYDNGDPQKPAQLVKFDGCTADTIALIDGNFIGVNSFDINQISGKLFELTLDVAYRNDRNEILTTQIYLRNA